MSIKEKLLSILHLKIFCNAKVNRCTVMLLLASQMCKEKQMRYEDGRLPNTIPFLNLGPDC